MVTGDVENFGKVPFRDDGYRDRAPTGRVLVSAFHWEGGDEPPYVRLFVEEAGSGADAMPAFTPAEAEHLARELFRAASWAKQRGG